MVGDENASDTQDTAIDKAQRSECGRQDKCRR